MAALTPIADSAARCSIGLASPVPVGPRKVIECTVPRRSPHFGASVPRFADRVHFLALMARVMRQVLVDYARSRAASKRGGGRPLPLDGQRHDPAAPAGDPATLLDLNLALEQLAASNPELARVVELYYFGGLTAEEIALVVSQTVHVVRHDLRAARAWLRRELSHQPAPPDQTGSMD